MRSSGSSVSQECGTKGMPIERMSERVERHLHINHGDGVLCFSKVGWKEQREMLDSWFLPSRLSIVGITGKKSHSFGHRWMDEERCT